MFKELRILLLLTAIYINMAYCTRVNPHRYAAFDDCGADIDPDDFNQQTDLEKEYAPEQWNKRFKTAAEAVKEFFNFGTIESDKARVMVPYETRSYGTDSKENFDLYGIDLPDDAPLAVYIHGGSWQMLNKTTSAYPVLPLYKAGYKVIILGYANCPDITLENLVQQIVRAAEFINAYADRLGTSHITYIGHSAGAHLILCMMDALLKRFTNAAFVKKIQHIVLISGLYDLSYLRHIQVVNHDNILGLADVNVAALSPMTFDYSSWTFLWPPININIFVGENDGPAFKLQAKQLQLIFCDYDLWSKYKMLADRDHFDIVEKLSQSSYEITESIVDNI